MRGLAVIQKDNLDRAVDLDVARRRRNAEEWGRRAIKAIRDGDFDLAINLCNQAKLELGHLKLKRA